MSSRWWTCTHDGRGLSGCPDCDKAAGYVGCEYGYLRDARDEIARLTAERAAATRILAALRDLPPETVGDVRRAAKRAAVDAWYDRFIGSADGAAANDARASRFAALADLLDEVRCG